MNEVNLALAAAVVIGGGYMVYYYIKHVKRNEYPRSPAHGGDLTQHNLNKQHFYTRSLGINFQNK